MKLREIAFVLLRLMAIWLFIYLTIPCIWGIIFYFNISNTEVFPNKHTVLLIYAFQAIISLLLSMVFWFYTEKISMIIYKDETEVELNNDNGKILEIALTIIGVYLIVTNLPGLISNSYSLIAEKSLSMKYYGGNIKSIIQNIAGIVIGIICINGKIDIVGLIKRLKTVGDKKPSK